MGSIPHGRSPKCKAKPQTAHGEHTPRAQSQMQSKTANRTRGAHPTGAVPNAKQNRILRLRASPHLTAFPHLTSPHTDTKNKILISNPYLMPPPRFRPPTARGSVPTDATASPHRSSLSLSPSQYRYPQCKQCKCSPQIPRTQNLKSA